MGAADPSSFAKEEKGKRRLMPKREKLFLKSSTALDVPEKKGVTEKGE